MSDAEHSKERRSSQKGCVQGLSIAKRPLQCRWHCYCPDVDNAGAIPRAVAAVVPVMVSVGGVMAPALGVYRFYRHERPPVVGSDRRPSRSAERRQHVGGLFHGKEGPGGGGVE